MKALNEYFLMVVFTLLLSRVYVFGNFMFNLNREFFYLALKTWKLGSVPITNKNGEMDEPKRILYIGIESVAF